MTAYSIKTVHKLVVMICNSRSLISASRSYAVLYLDSETLRLICLSIFQKFSTNLLINDGGCQTGLREAVRASPLAVDYLQNDTHKEQPGSERTSPHPWADT